MTHLDQLKADGYTVRPCPTCKKPAIWAKDAANPKQALWLEPEEPVYTVVMMEDRSDFTQRRRPEAVRNTMTFAEHKHGGTK